MACAIYLQAKKLALIVFTKLPIDSIEQVALPYGSLIRAKREHQVCLLLVVVHHELLRKEYDMSSRSGASFEAFDATFQTRCWLLIEQSLALNSRQAYKTPSFCGFILVLQEARAR